MKDNSTLEILWLHDNKITDMGAYFISQNRHLKDVGFGNNEYLTEEAAKMLCFHPTLEKLTLNGIFLDRNTLNEWQDSYAKEEVIDTLGINIFKRLKGNGINIKYNNGKKNRKRSSFLCKT